MLWYNGIPSFASIGIPLPPTSCPIQQTGETQEFLHAVQIESEIGGHNDGQRRGPVQSLAQFGIGAQVVTQSLAQKADVAQSTESSLLQEDARGSETVAQVPSHFGDMGSARVTQSPT